MKRIWFLTAAAPFLLAAFLHGQAKQPPAKAPEFKIPEEEAKRENPVKPTPAGLDAARKLYRTDCAVCHGEAGDGKGEIAADLKTKPRDWTTPAALEKLTDGEMMYIITKGKGEMLGEEGRIKTEQGWQLVNYVRSLAKKGLATNKPDKSQ